MTFVVKDEWLIFLNWKGALSYGDEQQMELSQ
jgi:hypothetical protein